MQDVMGEKMVFDQNTQIILSVHRGNNAFCLSSFRFLQFDYVKCCCIMSSPRFNIDFGLKKNNQI